MFPKAIPSRFLLLALCLSSLSGCAAVSNIDELNTLKAMGEEDKDKQKAVDREDAHFQKVKAAILEQKIQKGIRSTKVSSEWGEPIVSVAEGKNQRWIYKEKTADWFKGAKIYLTFDEDNRLIEWKCINLVCGNETSL